jgi:hypothetical protein
MQLLTAVVHGPPNAQPALENLVCPAYANISVLTVQPIASAPNTASVSVSASASAPAPTATSTSASATNASKPANASPPAPAATTASSDQKSPAAPVIAGAGKAFVIGGYRFELEVEADSQHLSCQSTKCVAPHSNSPSASSTLQLPAAPSPSSSSAAAAACAICAKRLPVYPTRALSCSPHAADALQRATDFLTHTSTHPASLLPTKAAL